MQTTGQAIIKAAFSAIFDPQKTAADVAAYFSPEYTQWVDGKTLDYAGFMAHVAVLKAHIAHATVHFLQFIEDGDNVSDIHDVIGVKTNGEPFSIRVIAFYTVSNQQITSVRELTHLLAGSAESKDLGSKT